MHPNTEDYLQEATNKKLKTYKKASTLATPSKAVETTGTIQAKATPPEPSNPVEPKEIPDTFMVHFWRMAKTHDMDVLLEACKEGRFLQGYRTMLSDDECSMVERIEIGMAKSAFDDTLENLLTVFGKGWDSFISIGIERGANCGSWPNFPDLKFFTKHVRHLFDQAAEYEAEKAAKAKPEPVIVPIEMAANASMTSHAVADLVVVSQPKPVPSMPTMGDADCLGLDPDQSVIPWTAEQGKAWFAEQLKKAADVKASEQAKKSKPKQPPSRSTCATCPHPSERMGKSMGFFVFYPTGQEKRT